MTKQSAQDIARHIICEKIKSGEIAVGDFLPAVDILAQKASCSQATVRLALTQLATEGIIKNSQGYGAKVIRIPSKGRIILVEASDGHLNQLLVAPIWLRLLKDGYDVDLLPPGLEKDEIYGQYLRHLGMSPTPEFIVAITPENNHPDGKSRFEEIAQRFNACIAYSLNSFIHLSNSICIATNPRAMAKQMVSHFIQQGHKSIAVTGGAREGEGTLVEQTASATIDFMEIMGGTCYVHYFADQLEHLLDLVNNKGVTALWALNDHSALKWQSILEEKGIKHVAIAGRYNTPHSWEKITSISLNPTGIAEAIIDTINMCKTQAVDDWSRCIMVDPELVPRQSTEKKQHNLVK